MNYQGHPYTESFISYPDIRPLLESLGHPSKSGNNKDQTLAAIYHPESLKNKVPGGQVINDGIPIALHLDEVHSDRPLFPAVKGSTREQTIELAEKVHGLYGKTFTIGKGRNIAIPGIPDILDDRGREYFIRTRTASHPEKKAPQDWTSEDPEEDWKAYEPSLKPIAEILAADPSGPFCLGETFSFADAIIMGQLVWFEKANKANLDRIFGLYDGVFEKLYKRIQKEGWVEGRGEEKEWPIPHQASL